MVLTACSSGANPGPGEAESTARRAPVSDFTVDCPTYDESAGAEGDDALPDVLLECLGSEGDPVDLGGAPPRPVVINLWASWCGPCLTEMPLLNEFAELAEGQVDVLGVVTQNSRSQATSYAAEMGIVFPSVVDFEGQVLNSQGFAALPATLLVAADGTIAYRHLGPYKTIEDLTSDVAEHLEVTV